MHWDVDNAAKNGKDLFWSFDSFFELDIFIPEGMRQEI
jgi:hypothetical protein